MNTKRLLTLCASIAAGLIGLRLNGFDLSLLWAPQPLLLVLALPLVLQALASGGLGGFRALGCALAADLEDRPPEAREAAGAVLRELAGLAVAVGVVAFLLDLLQLLVLLAASPGQAAPIETVVGLGAAILGPVYGILLKTLAYDPLATAVEPSPAELAAALVD